MRFVTGQDKERLFLGSRVKGDFFEPCVLLNVDLNTLMVQPHEQVIDNGLCKTTVSA